MNNQRIQELEEKIADLKKRWPAHCVSPALMRELDTLEEEFAEALEQVHQEQNHAYKDHCCRLPCLWPRTM